VRNDLVRRRSAPGALILRRVRVTNEPTLAPTVARGSVGISQSFWRRAGTWSIPFLPPVPPAYYGCSYT